MLICRYEASSSSSTENARKRKLSFRDVVARPAPRPVKLGDYLVSPIELTRHISSSVADWLVTDKNGKEVATLKRVSLVKFQLLMEH